MVRHYTGLGRALLSAVQRAQSELREPRRQGLGRPLPGRLDPGRQGDRARRRAARLRLDGAWRRLRRPEVPGRGAGRAEGARRAARARQGLAVDAQLHLESPDRTIAATATASSNSAPITRPCRPRWAATSRSSAPKAARSSASKKTPKMAAVTPGMAADWTRNTLHVHARQARAVDVRVVGLDHRRPGRRRLRRALRSPGPVQGRRPRRARSSARSRTSANRRPTPEAR